MRMKEAVGLHRPEIVVRFTSKPRHPRSFSSNTGITQLLLHNLTRIRNLQAIFLSRWQPVQSQVGVALGQHVKLIVSFFLKGCRGALHATTRKMMGRLRAAALIASAKLRLNRPGL
jgi:hypothetical protein